MKNVHEHIMKHLSSWRKRKGCHGDVPVPKTRLRCRCKRKSDGSVSCKDGGVLPITGFPHVGGKAKEGQRAPIVQTRGKTRVHLIQHAFIRSRAPSRGYTFEACIIGTDQVRRGK